MSLGAIKLIAQKLRSLVLLLHTTKQPNSPYNTINFKEKHLLDFLIIKHFYNRAENGTRTRDPNLGKVVLYQLSYFRRK